MHVYVCGYFQYDNNLFNERWRNVQKYFDKHKYPSPNFKVQLDLAFNNVKPKEKSFVFD